MIKGRYKLDGKARYTMYKMYVSIRAEEIADKFGVADGTVWKTIRKMKDSIDNVAVQEVLFSPPEPEESYE